ncbi:MAG TPA: hypothetical protein VLG12_01700 [Candidatus Saccharimonadales bacterium]|nr:hypothetical protein [Candidatus Saccharimonadales bacterium]
MKGQALVTLIFFMLFATTVTTAAVFVIATNSISGAKLQEGTIAYQAAESGADEAVLRFIRDSSYTGAGETLTIGKATATIQRSGSGPYIFLSTGRLGNFVKKVQVTVDYQNNIVTIVEKKEIF